VEVEQPKRKCSNNGHGFEEASEIADFLRTKTNIVPKIGIICGSGLGGLAEKLESPTTVEYKDIPGFRVSTGKIHIPAPIRDDFDAIWCFNLCPFCTLQFIYF
jgi:hypothetical protein